MRNLLIFLSLLLTMVPELALSKDINANRQKLCSKNSVDDGALRLTFRPENNNIHVIACPLNVDSDNDECDSLGYGNLYLYKKLSLSAPGDLDLVLKDARCCRGDNNVFLMQLFVNCGSGIYVRIGDGFFTEITISSRNSSLSFPDLYVTRECYNPEREKLELRKFTLEFDKERYKYGPPNNDLDLTEYCIKEMDMPFIKTIDP